jgi:hypothetical protein
VLPKYNRFLVELVPVKVPPVTLRVIPVIAPGRAIVLNIIKFKLAEVLPLTCPVLATKLFNVRLVPTLSSELDTIPVVSYFELVEPPQPITENVFVLITGDAVRSEEVMVLPAFMPIE